MSTTSTTAGRLRSASVRRGFAFWGLSVTLGIFLFASSVPSPLYVVYQREFGFSDVTLTSVFAIYALALLATLVVAGSVSDHAGRRPALFVALAIEVVAMLAFAEAQSVEWLFAARILQGVATGIAMGAVTAALLDLQPPRGELGALMGVAAPLTGLAAGALAAGLLVDYGPDPTHFIFWLLVVSFALAVLFSLTIPEPVDGDGRWRQSLRPAIAVPESLRGAFIATIPCLVATWALGGLVLSLGPSLTSTVLGQNSHVVGGLPIFVMAGISAIMSVRVRNADAHATAKGGLAALIAGVAVVLAGIAFDSIAVFLIGGAIAGLGFGPSFAGAFRALTSRAPEDHKAAFVSAILAVSYLSFSVPAVVAGVAITRFGLEGTTYVYGAFLMVLAAVALILTGRLADAQEDPLAD